MQVDGVNNFFRTLAQEITAIFASIAWISGLFRIVAAIISVAALSHNRRLHMHGQGRWREEGEGRTQRCSIISGYCQDSRVAAAKIVMRQTVHVCIWKSVFIAANVHFAFQFLQIHATTGGSFAAAKSVSVSKWLNSVPPAFLFVSLFFKLGSKHQLTN